MFSIAAFLVPLQTIHMLWNSQTLQRQGRKVVIPVKSAGKTMALRLSLLLWFWDKGRTWLMCNTKIFSISWAFLFYMENFLGSIWTVESWDYVDWRKVIRNIYVRFSTDWIRQYSYFPLHDCHIARSGILHLWEYVDGHKLHMMLKLITLGLSLPSALSLLLQFFSFCMQLEKKI